ncbi:hypothetical protein Pst134EA_025950 [Puccinia striiformis f. sp. tritici]|uniref:Uncharacterized protein n=1 Tax=Puccinia striiformis f. sp. tritici PST-78 TaxID=1165861 RepID=A0A0L0UZG1_9BASI|nr:hypothetical protein Pst134EA_025950 [Puccinia striiformis f. sp. tritici]KAH9452013.1 hypothetical protein Pst134EA_025950 [Puccinia striiformis f. sp. tritici]KAI9615205.1 hypothetical protein H4Q26_011747 [Puccinia striiformis f. sp. tritici PST-130]KNE92410.1 hypothetical protein PSTG_14187 [Puccinia striiformis f. sp. tritici PST-78]
MELKTEELLAKLNNNNQNQIPPGIRLICEGTEYSLFQAIQPNQTDQLSIKDQTILLSEPDYHQLYHAPLSEFFTNGLHQIFPTLHQEHTYEFVLNFSTLEIKVPEDNVYSQQLSLADIDRLHIGANLPDRLLIELDKQPRLVHRFNILANYVSQLIEQQQETEEEAEEDQLIITTENWNQVQPEHLLILETNQEEEDNKDLHSATTTSNTPTVSSGDQQVVRNGNEIASTTDLDVVIETEEYMVGVDSDPNLILSTIDDQLMDTTFESSVEDQLAIDQEGIPSEHITGDLTQDGERDRSEINAPVDDSNNDQLFDARSELEEEQELAAGEEELAAGEEELAAGEEELAAGDDDDDHLTRIELEPAREDSREDVDRGDDNPDQNDEPLDGLTDLTRSELELADLDDQVHLTRVELEPARDDLEDVSRGDDARDQNYEPLAGVTELARSELELEEKDGELAADGDREDPLTSADHDLSGNDELVGGVDEVTELELKEGELAADHREDHLTSLEIEPAGVHCEDASGGDENQDDHELIGNDEPLTGVTDLMRSEPELEDKAGEEEEAELAADGQVDQLTRVQLESVGDQLAFPDPSNDLNDDFPPENQEEPDENPETYRNDTDREQVILDSNSKEEEETTNGDEEQGLHPVESSGFDDEFTMESTIVFDNYDDDEEDHLEEEQQNRSCSPSDQTVNGVAEPLSQDEEEGAAEEEGQVDQELGDDAVDYNLGQVDEQLDDEDQQQTNEKDLDNSEYFDDTTLCVDVTLEEEEGDNEGEPADGDELVGESHQRPASEGQISPETPQVSMTGHIPALLLGSKRNHAELDEDILMSDPTNETAIESSHPDCLLLDIKKPRTI